MWWITDTALYLRILHVGKQSICLTKKTFAILLPALNAKSFYIIRVDAEIRNFFFAVLMYVYGLLYSYSLKINTLSDIALYNIVKLVYVNIGALCRIHTIDNEVLVFAYDFSIETF